MTDVPTASATVIASPPPPPRWPTLMQIFFGGIGAATATGGLLIGFGGWQGDLNSRVVTLERDMAVVQSNQRQYIPVLVGLQADLKYLADRARRDDDRRDREGRPR